MLWGGDVRTFHPPPGRFDGVIGGPPCQSHSKLGKMAKRRGQKVGEDLIPEFERCVAECQPTWFLMENVPDAPPAEVDGYGVDSFLFDNRLDAGGEQRRVRRWSFGSRQGHRLALPWWKPPTPSTCIPTVTANGSFWDPVKQQSRGDKTRRVLRLTLRAQGLPEDYLDGAPLTVAGAIKVAGNGVPIPMGRALARAVRAALEAS